MAEDASRNKRLGRGLAALLGEVENDVEAVERARSQRRVPIEFVSPNPRNPRQNFDVDDLEDLTKSVREKGIVQPILVRPAKDSDDRFEIIAGERRWRAAQRASLHEIPVLIQEVSDKEALELAIVENVQRADLDPIEEASGYHQLIEEFGYSQQEMADIIGKSRPHVANTLRLLKLPGDVQSLLIEGRLTAGHAKILVTVDNPSEVARQILENELSVRGAEDLVRGENKRTNSSVSHTDPKDADSIAVERSISEALGLVVDLRHKSNGQGELRIKYKSLEQLDLISEKLKS